MVGLWMWRNLGLLCERHHGKVHHGYSVERDADGVWHTYRPDGTEILLDRDHLLDGADSAGEGLRDRDVAMDQRLDRGEVFVPV